MGRLKIQMLWTDGTGPVMREDVIETESPWAYDVGLIAKALFELVMRETPIRREYDDGDSRAAASGAAGEPERGEAAADEPAQ